MKKLIIILLMLALIVTLSCSVAAETAPDADPDAPVDNTPADDGASGEADDSVENGSNGEIAEDNVAKDENATDTEGETEIGGVDTPADKEFNFTPSAFAKNLEYMGVGMVGIFLVIGIIILATVLLNRVFSGKEKD